MPDPSNYLNIGGLLEKDWSDDIIVFDDKDLIEFNFDPLIKNQNDSNRRYGQLLDIYNEYSKQITGNEVDLNKLPIISKSFNRTDINARKDHSAYFDAREIVRKSALRSRNFRSSLPQYKQKEYIDSWTEEVYGLWKTGQNMLPPESEERNEMDELIGNKFAEHYKRHLDPIIENEAHKYALGWVGGKPGEYFKSAITEFQKTQALSKQSQSDYYGLGAAALELLEGNPAVSALGFNKTAELLGEQIRESGRKEELKYEELLSTYIKPTGKYLESVGDMPSNMINPLYAWMKLIENSPNQILTTGVGVLGGLAAGSMVTSGYGATIGATLFGQLPGLMVNYSLEAGDMYGSARDYLYDLRDEAKSSKGRIGERKFNENYTYSISENKSVTADQLTDNDIHNISKDLSTLYGLISTGIEGSTNVVGMAKWLKGYGSTISKGMATKEGKDIMGRTFARTIGKKIRNFSNTKTVSAIFGAGMESIQEALQEGTGELMRAKALPGYKFDKNVPLDAAYSGLLFGGTTQAGLGLVDRYKKKYQERDDYIRVPRNSKYLSKHLQPEDNIIHADQDIINEEVNSVKGIIRDDSDLEAVLKAGVLIYDTDVDKLADILSQGDPLQKGELTKRIYDLHETTDDWIDAENLTNIFTGRLSMLEKTLGLTKKDLLENADVDFNNKQLSEIFEEPYTKTSEERLIDEDIDLTVDNEPINEIVDYSSSHIDADHLESMQELKALRQLLVQRKDEEGTDTYKDIEKDIKKLEKELKVHEESRPQPKDDPNAQIKQNIVKQVRDLKVKLTPKEYTIINSSQRKNASQLSIDKALRVIEDNKDKKPEIDPEEVSFDEAYGEKGAEPDPNKRFGIITYKKDSQKEKAEVEVKFSEDGKIASIIEWGTVPTEVTLSKKQQAKLKDINEGLNSENAMEKGFAQEDQEALQDELLEAARKISYPVSVEDLERMTIPQIKEAAEKNGIKLEGRLRKDLIKSYDEQTGMSQVIPDDGSYDTFESKVREAEDINSKYEDLIQKAKDKANEEISDISRPDEKSGIVISEDRQQELEQIQDIEDDRDNNIRVLKEQREKELARLDMPKETPVMTQEDVNIQAKNADKITVDETWADEIVFPDELEYLKNNDPTQLLNLAQVKDVPELDQYVEEDGRLKLDADNLDKLISAIQNAQGAVYLAGGVGGFPLRKKSTRQRLYRWYDLLWRQASEKFGYTDKDFHPWANDIQEAMPERTQGYFREWALKSPAPVSQYDSLVNKAISAIGLDDSPEGISQEELSYVEERLDEFGRKESTIYEENTDDSGGDTSFKEGWNRVNSIAFEPLGLYLDSKESSYIRKMVNLMPDFDTWLSNISENIPLPDGRTIWEVSQDQNIRRKLKTLYVSSLNRNVQRINRNQIDKGARVNLEFEVDSEGNFVISQIKGANSRQKIGKLNTQWARKMHGENYLGDVDLIWSSGSDILQPSLLKDSSGNPRKSTRWGRFMYGLKKRYSFFTADELNDLTNTYFKELGAIPLFVRGEEDQMALVKITKEHRDAARNPENYWANEDLPNKMKNEYMDGDNFIIGANIARHEAMQQIFGSDYHTLSAQKIMQRIKAFFTPGVSVEGGPPSKVVYFDPNGVTFETTLRDGRKIVKNAVERIDEKDQYIGDGNTITSEKKFKYTYPKLLGTDPRAKRAKTIIGAHDETGVLIGKHQEMTMYVPNGAEMRVMRGDKVIAIIKSNGDTTDISVNGQYVDHLMTEDEAKIRLGDFNTKEGEIFEIPSEATTHIQAVGNPKSHANFPMQLMNYITDRRLQDAISNMMMTQDHEKSTVELIKNIFNISKSGKQLDKFLISLKDRLDDAPPQYVIAAAELGAGRHPTNQGSASILANSKFMKKSMSVMQNGAVLDFRPDYTGAVKDDEIILPTSVPAISNQVYQKYADAEGITLEEAKKFNPSVINKWLRENEVRIMLVRFPVPSALGYGIFRVKSLMGGLSGDSFIVSPKVVKERFEGDHDHDTGHISFLDDEILDLLQSNQQPTQGINLEQYLPDDHEGEYSFSNLNDVYKLMEELSYGSKAIGEIANVQRIAGVAQNHFEHIILDGKKIVQVKLDSVVKDPNMTDKNGKPVEDTLGNIFRIYAQASFDNAKFRLLAKWGYNQDNLFKLMFKNSDGTELTDRQFNTFKEYLRVLRMNGYIANSGSNDGRHTLKETFEMSRDYHSFIQNRELYVAHRMANLLRSLSPEKIEDYATVGEIKLKLDNIHPHETLSSLPAVLAEKNVIDIDQLFDIDADGQRSAVVHNETSLNIIAKGQARSSDIMSVAGDMNVAEVISEAEKGGQWAQSMINALDKLYMDHMQEGNSLSDVVSQTWDYNEEFLQFAQNWYEGGEDIAGFKDLSLVAQKAATYDFLSGLRRRNNEGGSHATYNNKMIPPVSREGTTLLDPEIMERYFNEYNNLYENKFADLTKVKVPKKFIPIIKTSQEIKEVFGCE